jgi:hypothetical protein
MNYSTTASLSELFIFPFQGKNWAVKLLIAFALSVLGVLTFFVPSLFVLGYLARLMRQVSAGWTAELPEWDNWGELFVDGLKVAFTALIYSLPSLACMAVAYLSMLTPAFLPLFAQTGEEEVLALLVTGGSFAGLCLMGAAMLVWLATIVLMPVAVTHLIARDSLSAAFQVRDWWRVLRANLGGFLVAFLLMLGLFMLTYFVYNVLFLTIVLCFLAPLAIVLFSVYQLLVGGALYAAAYWEATSRLAGPQLTSGKVPGPLSRGISD